MSARPVKSSIKTTYFCSNSTGFHKRRDLFWEQRVGGSNPSAPTSKSTIKRSLRERIGEAAHELQRPIFYAVLLLITAYLRVFTLQAKMVSLQTDGMDCDLYYAERSRLLYDRGSVLCRRGAKEGKNPVMAFLTARYRKSVW